ncbi:EAL domain-containing protein [Vibrio makurazakiensis]|uniref:bifunctional diguanylate cyclase/phosphodiesterase n=1 Tax=Vibrio makurazakiensis TaxID=2910250 RepID=UPI003D0A6291
MAVFRKNIWMIYAFIVGITLILFSLYGYLQFKENRKDFKFQQTLQVELFSTSANSLFTSQEALLEVIGYQLVNQNDFTRTASMQIRPILDQLLDAHTAIAAFGLTNPKGDYISVTSNIALSEQPNLLSQEHTRESFQAALNSPHMVIGRTYYQNSLGSYVIPIRKAIHVPGQGVKAVMTAGLKIDDVIAFHNEMHAGPYNTLSLIRTDHYRQFMSSDRQGSIYENPVDKALYKLVLSNLASQHAMTVEEAKVSNQSYSVEVQEPIQSSLITVKFLRDYNLWVVGRTNLDYVDNLFYQKFSLYFVVFMLLNIGFYSLVNSVAKGEKKSRNQLIYQASHDSLTLLPNRHYLRMEMHRWLENKTQPFSLLFIDIDSFKSVNDTHGHDFGDKVLKLIASRLSTFVKPSDLMVREASDEFIFLTCTTDTEQVKELAQDIIDALAVPYEVNGSQFLLSSSIGASKFPKHGNDLDALLRAADIAMYQAKQQQNSYSLFTSKMQESHLFKMKVEQKLRLAIENNQLFMVFQPQVKADGSIHGVEALIRWIDEELGFIAPDVFIPIAESSGLMGKLGRFIIESSIEQIASLQRNDEIKFGLSVNVSVRQFMQPDFASHILDVLKKNSFEESLLTLEITENLFIEDLGHVKPICEELHRKNIKISLDDFGTGYSSLSMLKALPIDEVKIDKSFIDSIHSDQQSLTMVQNIIAIGKNFGMIVLAEGVESTDQFDILKQCQCDLMQGYLFSKPITSKELTSYLK